MIRTVSHVTSPPLGSAYRCYYCTPILPTGPVNPPHFLSLSLAGVNSAPYIFMQNLHHLDHPPSPPPSGPPTQLASMSYSHLYPAAVLLPVLPPRPGFCKVFLWDLSDVFHIGYSAAAILSRQSTSNHPSSAANRPVISAYISQEVSAGRMVGPLAV